MLSHEEEGAAGETRRANAGDTDAETTCAATRVGLPSAAVAAGHIGLPGVGSVAQSTMSAPIGKLAVPLALVSVTRPAPDIVF